MTLRSVMTPLSARRAEICVATRSHAPTWPSGRNATSAPAPTSAPINDVMNGTFLRPSASRTQSTLERSPNIGAAVMSARTAGWTW
jgi:hypothetical protein